ncbi:hypothetical protein [Maribacter luteus]|uniref:Uncharacterized protein n=1 Tax=Maribacter luteus TaxID=2594478 RepID=A0A6I2MSJ4_9FLAO|nr:hypothetical protein [Maribacter luteus]MRX65505.1 hypothetical protein [Maribacter luteus]
MTKSLEALTIQQARKLVLLSQRVPPIKHKGSALDATLQTIEHLGYIQTDTISAVQRAHHYTLYSRNPRYKKTHLVRFIVENSMCSNCGAEGKNGILSNIYRIVNWDITGNTFVGSKVKFVVQLGGRSTMRIPTMKSKIQEKYQ